MSRVYEVKLKTRVDQSVSPLLYDFLDKSINSNEVPSKNFFAQFVLPDLAALAFDFIRYAKSPEYVWGSSYSEDEINARAHGWLEHSQHSNADAYMLKELAGTKESGSFPFAFRKKRDVKDLKTKNYIGQYPQRSFENGVFYFCNEYSSNGGFNLEKLLAFLNKNRDKEEKLYVAYFHDESEMPSVTLYVDDEEVVLFGGVISSRFKASAISYDRNGYFSGEFKDRPASNGILGCCGYLPPVDMKYKIDWLDEADVMAVKSAYEFYAKQPNFGYHPPHLSKREQRERNARDEAEKLDFQQRLDEESARIKELSDPTLLRELDAAEGRMFTSSNSLSVPVFSLLIAEINDRGIQVEPQVAFDPKGDRDLFFQVQSALRQVSSK